MKTITMDFETYEKELETARGMGRRWGIDDIWQLYKGLRTSDEFSNVYCGYAMYRVKEIESVLKK